MSKSDDLYLQSLWATEPVGVASFTKEELSTLDAVADRATRLEHDVNIVNEILEKARYFGHVSDNERFQFSLQELVKRLRNII